jgi:CDP-glucose 4,6-dehydratase
MKSALERAFLGKRVFLTGHTGFKGGWLATWLKLLGARIYGYSLPVEPASPSLYESIRVSADIEERLDDICDFRSLLEAVRSFQPEVVFHLAAQSLVRRSCREPLLTYATNVLGTAHLLEAVRCVPSVRAVVVVTSDKCYENRERESPYSEIDRLGGQDPYSSSKACAELVTAAYRHSFFNGAASPQIASCRAGNVIGGGDWAEDRLLPDIARAILAGRPVLLRNPEAVRPWQHVLEPLHGYLMVAGRLLEPDPPAAQTWNFGPDPGAEVAVANLARMVLAAWGQGAFRIATDPAACREAHTLRLDSSQARLGLGWRPRLTLHQAVDLTVDWYRRHEEDPASLAELTLAQIEAYMARSEDSYAA